MPLRNVLIVSDFAKINGGQAKVAIDGARLAADAGLNVTFFAAVGPADPMLYHPGISVELLGHNDILSEPSRSKAVVRGIWNSEARRKLMEVATRFDPSDTVLHCHGYAKALSPAIGPILTDGPLPTVYTMHEYFLACPNGGFYHYNEQKICTRKPLGLSCITTNCDVRGRSHKAFRVLRQAVTWGPGRMPGRMRNLIYISQTQKNAVEPYLPSDANLYHVPNPIPFADMSKVDATQNDAFLFVGRLNPEKGGKIFAEAARIANVRAVFVGDGSEADAIRAANKDAEILGWKTPDEVHNWLGKARALVFPSLWYEGQPLTPLEALAREVPVVCGTWSAAAECVTNGKNGVLYETPDASALAAAINAVKEIDFEPVAEVIESMAPQAHWEKLHSVYESVIEDYRKSTA